LAGGAFPLAAEGFADLVHAVEQLEQALTGQFRQRLADGPALVQAQALAPGFGLGAGGFLGGLGLAQSYFHGRAGLVGGVGEADNEPVAPVGP